MASAAEELEALASALDGMAKVAEGVCDPEEDAADDVIFHNGRELAFRAAAEMARARAAALRAEA
ncbi:hypothetical protein [Sorangium sp. So ce388]|uniref:hypothetical protein n=1 Tax=Sorangium sp. So ce388 TaxID=3133309 RepID=UPI003F5BF3E4